MTAPFDFASLLAPGTPAPAVKWNGFPKYNFIGGHNDAKNVPVDALIAAATAVLKREGATLATYGLNSGPLGYRPLREFLAGKLKGHAGIKCSPDEILITSGSMQGLDLINSLLVAKGDTVLIEQETYGGALTKLNKLGANVIGIPLDDEGLRLDVLEEKLAELKKKGVTPKYIYTIPTVQNPTGAIMGEKRRADLIALAARYGVMIFEDECYSDLIWSGKRPKSLFAMANGEGVIHIGSFSKSIAPALRVGYIVAKWEVLARILGLKQDAGSGALEQMVLAEFCKQHFADHVPKLNKVLAAKLQTLREALAEQFGTAAEFGDPEGGIYLWIKLPDQVDTTKLAQAALAAGVSLNPGQEWSTNKDYARSRLRLCFANPEPETIKKGVEVLAEVCRREFGVPLRSANVEKGA
ncbi:PLP-dependent aminotransferase family protein [Reyranella sp.]|uniref:aminotransferase-like domain-containing protein n=1 Tax=Reyranella sp. TaxID=1929291 RepID=UPI0011FE54B6|nr:PLP-dependent aminotransferase family protein [Reyranella sp.]TAJ85936.1 MAG: PLP-dependent aminotransferase family protein [Reyranella sp.]